MKIGIDLDGVVFDSDRMFDAYAELFDIDHNGKGKQCEHRFAEIAYGWSDDLFYEYFGKYMEIVLNDAPLMSLTKEILARLKADGHELVVITNRSSVDSKEEKLTIDRLAKENLTFDKVCFKKGSKAPTAKEEKIDVMIENTPEVIEDLCNNGIKCLYFKTNTKDINHPLVKTVQNWAEIYRAIINWQ